MTRRRAALAAAVGVIPLVALASLARDAPARAKPTSGYAVRWAYVLRPVAARVRPDPAAPIVTFVNPVTPEGEPNLVLILGEHRHKAGMWIRVGLSILPRGASGWVRHDALGELHVVRTRLVVDRRLMRAVLYRDGRPIFRAPVGVGQRRWPTPRGEYYVRQKLTRFGDPFYGPVAFGTSARSAVLTDWPGGGYIGIHGTNQPELLPGRVSHGCIRMRNTDILQLARVLPLGTPLTIR